MEINYASMFGALGGSISHVFQVIQMTELHQAAAAGDYDLVEDIVKKNRCNPNQKDIDWNYKTPLHWAAAKGQTDMVRILVEYGARPCLRTDAGWTPAHFAAESGRLGVLRLLHSLHAPIDKEDCCGDRPIRISEIYGHKDCVEFLEVAEVECRDYRRMARLRGITLDDTDEEWEEQMAEMAQSSRRQGSKNDKGCVPKKTVKLHTGGGQISKTHISGTVQVSKR